MPVEVMYSNNILKINKDSKFVEEQEVVIGDKGVRIKYYKIEDKKMEKIVITGKDGKYIYKSYVDKDVETLEFDSLKKAIAKDSRLKFALEYVKSIIKSDVSGGGNKQSGRSKAKTGSKTSAKTGVKTSAKTGVKTSAKPKKAVRKSSK